MKITSSKENYLKAIAEAQAEGEPVIAATLARWLDVSPPAVTMALRRLKRDGCIQVDKEGRVTALIVSVGGFLGAGEKDVAVPFSAVQSTQKNDKWYLVMNATKDALKTASGYKYDKSKTQWVPDAK